MMTTEGLANQRVLLEDKFTRAEQTLNIRSIIGTLESGYPLTLPLRKSVVRVPSKILYLLRSNPITLST